MMSLLPGSSSMMEATPIPPHRIHTRSHAGTSHGGAGSPTKSAAIVTPAPSQHQFLRRQMAPPSNAGMTAITFVTAASPSRTRSASLGRQFKSPTRRPVHARQGFGRANESTAKKSYKSLQRLKQSNAILEKVLADQREKEQQLECNLRILESSLKRSKDNQLRETVRTLNSSLFLLLVAGLLWGNWVMFSPHFDAMVMACLVAAVLREIQLKMIFGTEFVQNRLLAMNSWLKASMVGTLGLVALAAHLSLLNVGDVASLIALVACVSLVWFVLRYSSARALTATWLTLTVTLLICFPLAVIIKSCAAEMQFVGKFLINLLENRNQMRVLVDRLNTLSGVRWLIQQAKPGRAAVEPEDLTEWLKNIAGAFDANSAVGLVSNASNLIWAFGTFAATLFSILQLDLEKLWETQLASFSPLPSDDNVEVYKTVRTSTWQVFAGSASVGLMHGMLTYLALSMANSPLCMLPAFVSASLAVAPFFGSWLPLVPFVVGFLLADRQLDAVFVASVQVLAFAVLNPWLTSKFPPSARFIGGLPIVAGLFAWGLCGIVYGPLLVGLSIVTANIYLRYTSLRAVPMQAFDDGEEEDDLLNSTTMSAFQTGGGDESFFYLTSPKHQLLNTSIVSATDPQPQE